MKIKDETDKADYWMGYAYDRLMQKRLAELYWNTGIAAADSYGITIDNR